MKKIFLSFAKYNEEANHAIAGILEKLSNDEREKDRGSYYGSLSGLFRHVVGGTVFFLGLFRDAVSNNAAAVKALEGLAGFEHIEGELTGEQWKKIVSFAKTADKTLLDFVNALNDGDFSAQVKLDWYGGNPSSVPLSFMLQQHTVHNTHHRGQISQILDSMKIDNDYSGINVAFL